MTLDVAGNEKITSYYSNHQHDKSPKSVLEIIQLTSPLRLQLNDFVCCRYLAALCHVFALKCPDVVLLCVEIPQVPT